MVKLSDTQGKSLEQISSGAYARCFGDLELSQLLSRVQSLIIKNGYELENIITNLVSDLLIKDLDDFLSAQIMGQGLLKRKLSNNVQSLQVTQSSLILSSFSA